MRLVLATVVTLALLCACEDGEEKCYFIESCPALGGQQLQVCCKSAKCTYNVPTDVATPQTFECNAVFPGCATAHDDAYAYCGIVVVDAGPPPDGGSVVTPHGAVLTTLRPTHTFATSNQIGLILDGTDFTSDTQVFLDGSLLASSFRSAGEVTVTIPGGFLTTAGFHAIAVQTPGFALGQSLQLTVDAVPPPAVTSTQPAEVRLGSGDLDLQLFVDDATLAPGWFVQVDGFGLTPVHRVAGSITVRVSADRFTSARGLDVLVGNPSPGGNVFGTTGHLFVVESGAPLPVVTSVDPSLFSGPTTVTVTGASFDGAATVRFLDHNLSTTFGSDTSLGVTFGPDDALLAATFPLVVVNPPTGGGGGASGPFNVTINTGSNVAPTLATGGGVGSVPLGGPDTEVLLAGDDLGRATAVRLSRSGFGDVLIGSCDMRFNNTTQCFVTVPAIFLLEPLTLNVVASNFGLDSNSITLIVQ